MSFTRWAEVESQRGAHHQSNDEFGVLFVRSKLSSQTDRGGIYVRREAERRFGLAS